MSRSLVRKQSQPLATPFTATAARRRRRAAAALALLGVVALMLGAPAAWAQAAAPTRAALRPAPSIAGAGQGQVVGTEPLWLLPPPLAVGFHSDLRLREAVLQRLVSSGRYRLTAEGRLPVDPRGLLVSGFLSEQRAEHGWLDCRVRFFLVRQPGQTLAFVDTVAASVPYLPLRGQKVLAMQREAQAAATEEACLNEAAAQIADRVAHGRG